MPKRWHRLSAPALAVVAMSAALWPAFGSDQVRIANDHGGQIGEYLNAARKWRKANKKIVIDGSCESACTVVLAVIARDRICVTSRARLGFHAAWRPDFFGQPIVDREASRVLFDLYPKDVQDWIRQRGGLSPTVRYLEGTELTRYFERCPQEWLSALDVKLVTSW